MRRSLAEWLLIPLFLLPVVVGAVLVSTYRSRYLAEVRSLRTHGETEVRERLGREDAALWISAIERFSIPRHTQGAMGYVSFVRERRPGVPPLHIRCFTQIEQHLAPEKPVWRFVEGLPVGIGPAVLGDPEARLKLETGAASAVEVCEATRTLRELIQTPDLDRLREASLSLSTKLYILRHWRDADPPSSFVLMDLVGMLVAVRNVKRWRDENPEANPGAYDLGSPKTLLLGPGEPPAVQIEHARRGGVTLHVPGTESVWLRCVFHGDLLSRRRRPRPEDGTVLWEGRLEGPVAGTWQLISRHGEAWWRTGDARRWAGPLLGGGLAYLLIPTALLVSIRRRRRLDEARRRFITELAHDLRTPLTSVRLYAEMLEAGRVANGDRDEYVSVVARESGRLSSLLANLLDLSRLDRGMRTFDTKPVDIANVVAAAVRDFLALEPGRSDDVTTDGPPACRALADPDALSRTLANLLENAGKFTEPGVAIEVRWRDEPDAVKIVVSDEGPGIPPAERSRLFERYVRGERAARDGIPGTGLGLSLVRELAEGVGGTVRHVESPEGAVFEIALRKADDA